MSVRGSTFKLELGVWFGKLQVSRSNCPGETCDLVKMYEKIKEKILVAFGPLSKRQKYYGAIKLRRR